MGWNFKFKWKFSASNLLEASFIFITAALLSNVQHAEAVVSDSSITNFVSAMDGLGSLMSPQRGRSNAGNQDLSKALVHVFGMMQGVGSMDGSPPFLGDAESLKSLETIVSSLGPFVCSLPKASSRELDNIASILGGMLGSLIGNMIAMQQTSIPGDLRPMLSGMGGVAGAIGGLTGSDMGNMNNISNSLELIPIVMGEMGDLKGLVDGSFAPPSGADELMTLIGPVLEMVMGNMGDFMGNVGPALSGPSGRSLHFERRFHGVTDEFADYVKAVSGAAGSLGGIMGYIVPHAMKLGAANAAPIRSGLWKMRKHPRGRSATTEVFGGIIKDLVEVAADLGGVSGVMGSMMGRVIGNVGNIHANALIPEGVMKASAQMAELNKGTNIVNEIQQLTNKLMSAMPAAAKRKPDKEMELCMKYITLGVGQLGMMDHYGGRMPENLAFEPLYGSAEDSAGDFSLLRQSVGSEWAGNWESAPKKKEVSGNVDPKQFSNVLTDEALSDNTVLRFIDDMVLNHGINTNVIRYLKGTLFFDQISSEDRKSIPAAVLGGMKELFVSRIDGQLISELLSSPKLGDNPTKLISFLENVPSNNFIQAVNLMKQNGIHLGKQSRSTAQIVVSFILKNHADISNTLICPFMVGVPPRIIANISMSDIMDNNLLACIQSVRHQISPALVMAWIKGRTENKNISEMGLLSDFADDIPAEVYMHMSQQELTQLVDDGFFSNISESISDDKLWKTWHVVSHILALYNDTNANSAQLISRLGVVQCGMDFNDINRMIPAIDQPNWVTKCVTQRQANISLHKAICAEDKSKANCKQYTRGAKMKKVFRQQRVRNFNGIKESLSNIIGLTGPLPLNISTSMHLLTVSDIRSIPGASLAQSIDVVANNPDLSKIQRAALYSTLMGEGYQTNSIEQIAQLGELASELTPSTTPFSLIHSNLRNRPDLIRHMQKHTKVNIMDKVVTYNGTASAINMMSSLSRMIPTSKIRSLPTINFTAASRMRWTRSQAIVIVNKYQDSVNRKLTSDDISYLGSAAIGLTCKKVFDFPLDSIINVAVQIDRVVGNSIPSDLANCIANKIYVLLRMEKDKQKYINDIVGRVIPGNFLLFLPSSVLRSVAYNEQCLSMVRRLSHVNLDLLSIGVGELQLDGVMEAVDLCMKNRQTKMQMHGQTYGPQGSYGPQGPHDSYGPQGSNVPQGPHDSYGPQGPHDSYGSQGPHDTYGPQGSYGPQDPSSYPQGPPMYPPGQMGPDQHNSEYKDYYNNQSYPHYGNGPNQNDQYGNSLDQSGNHGNGPPPSYNYDNAPISNFNYPGMPSRIEKEDVMLLGKLSCALGHRFYSISTEAFIEFAKLASQCRSVLTEANVRAIDNRFMEFVYGQSLDEHIVTALAPLFPFLSREALFYIPSDLLTPTMLAVPLMAKRRKHRAVVGDRSTTTLSIEKNLLVKMPGNSSSSDLLLNFDPVNMHKMAETVLPKVIDHVIMTNNLAGASEQEQLMIALNYTNILTLGPSLINVPTRYIDYMPYESFTQALAFIGRLDGWTTEQLNAFRKKLVVAGEVSVWSPVFLQDLGHLLAMLSVPNITQLANINLDVLETMSHVAWPTPAHKTAILYRYMELQVKNAAELTGVELVALGDLLCGISLADIANLNSASVTLALSSISQTLCFDEAQLLSLKTRVQSSLSSPLYLPSVLNEIGIIASALSVAELQQIQPAHTSLISPYALRIISPDKILNAWNASHLALLGTNNGMVMISRNDIFMQLSNRQKNAVVRAGFGANAAKMFSQINMMLHSQEFSTQAFQNMMNRMMNTASLLFKKIFQVALGPPKRHAAGGLGAAFNLADPSDFIKPPPPEFAVGLKKQDFTKTLNTKYLDDRRVIEFINQAATADANVLEVIKGDVSINTLTEESIKSMPPKVFEAMKPSQIEEMNGQTLALLLDSDRASRDPAAVSKVLRKLTTVQFESAMEAMNAKMNAPADTSKLPWRPPTAIQSIIFKDYVKRMNKYRDEEMLTKFIRYLCPFTAGAPANIIRKIPHVKSKRVALTACFAKSYEDLDDRQKNQFANWIYESVGKDESDQLPLDVYDKFLLDVPLGRIKRHFNYEKVLSLVEDGYLSKLDYLHARYKSFTKSVLKILFTNPSKFDETAFLDKLTHSQCDIPLRRVKRSMSKASLKHLAKYTLSHCKNKEEILKESSNECSGEQALRLRRCQLVAEKVKKVMKKAPGNRKKVVKKAKVTRVDLGQFSMMRELAGTLLEDKDLSSMSADEVKEVAGALGGLTTQDIDKLPDTAVLEAMSSIKDNTNLSPKQKRIMFKKAKKAGLTIQNSADIADLGELISEVPASELKMISTSDLKSSMKEFTKRAAGFSRSQKKAIVSKLQEMNLDDMLNENLGDFASEISLSKLKSMQSVNLSQVRNQPWERGQAAKIVEMYRNGSEYTALTAELVSELGSTVIGLKCSDVMDMSYDDVLEAAISIHTSANMAPDMDECTQRKLDNSLQIDLGLDYMINTTGDDATDLFSSIPADVAMFYPIKALNGTSSETCEMLFNQIGQSELNSLPPGPGDVRRMKLAGAAYNCLSPNRSIEVLTEENVLMLGNLLCDMPSGVIGRIATDALPVALGYMQDCVQRFTTRHVLNFQSLVQNTYGASYTWDDGTLSALGPMLAIMPPSDISSLNQESFIDVFDEIIPPIIDESLPVYASFHYSEFYSKAREAFIAQRATVARKKRSLVVPTFDEIVAVGPGNSGWSVEQLEAITDSDLINALVTLGAVEQWSDAQRNVLKTRLEQAISPLSQWSSDVVADAKHILTNLTTSEISSLDISLDTATVLSELSWDNNQRTAAFDKYMSQNSKSSSTLTADEIAGLSSLLCGISESQLMNIPVATISTTVKDIGTLTCLDQTQLDMFYAMVMMGYPSGVPDGALLQEMRVIAAGMTVPALQSLPLDVMSFISPAVYDAISPSRVKDGLSTLQLSASGITNIATILRNTRLFNDLTADQQDTLKLAAYGIDAVLDGSANSTGFDIDIFTGDDGGSNIIFEDNMNETTTAGSKLMIPFKYLSILFALLAVVLPINHPFL